MPQPKGWEMKKNKKRKKMGKNKKNHSGQSGQEINNLDREDKIELHGTVEDALPGTWFKILTETNSNVLATLGGKLRQNHIRILPGDNVVIEVSPYDLTRGRIVYRK